MGPQRGTLAIPTMALEALVLAVLYPCGHCKFAFVFAGPGSQLSVCFPHREEAGDPGSLWPLSVIKRRR
uniref:MIP22379p n=1 Tax=Drosophila melanogaster TaxID=7227 RepID=D6W4N2_DROME|nr:MIP22379p [Drosophila melanogaster]